MKQQENPQRIVPWANLRTSMWCPLLLTKEGLAGLRLSYDLAGEAYSFTPHDEVQTKLVLTKWRFEREQTTLRTRRRYRR
jgi:hypothetical protein